jgi:hypothetical protein
MCGRVLCVCDVWSRAVRVRVVLGCTWCVSVEACVCVMCVLRVCWVYVRAMCVLRVCVCFVVRVRAVRGCTLRMSVYTCHVCVACTCVRVRVHVRVCMRGHMVRVRKACVCCVYERV